ncbi:HNH endonuclease family protein [Allokutzneria multivorans]|uniref:HNH endonuclease family protein n=1 Tax=Allokutzneria multivorans TaxID=1142134 RepID=A0ABP7SD71_9PSEU
MQRIRPRALAALTAILIAATLTAAPASAAPRGLPELPTLDLARTQLAELTRAEEHSMMGYDRTLFRHWGTHADNCDTRELVLARDGDNVTRDAACRAVTGTWISLYDKVVITSASNVDIDHIVPLAAGWRSGAWEWDAAKRKAFANDLTHPQLLAVSAKSNRSKGDQTPATWRPPARDSWCDYSKAWSHVKSIYRLSVTEAERSALTEMLDTCT